MQSDDTGDYTHDQVDIAYHMPFLEECASRASIIVEIGCGHGNGSTRAFARGLERSDCSTKLHIGVDHDSDRPQVKPLRYWREVHGSSGDISTLETVLELTDGACADIIFIDTDHTYQQMQKELPVWSQIAGPSTLWIFHDTYMFDQYNHMTDAIKEFCEAHPEWEFVDHSQASHGLGLMRRKS